MSDHKGHETEYVRGAVRQFTWQEGLWLSVVMLSYMIGYGIHISIMADKFALEDPPTNRWLYVFFFLLSHICAGLKNVQYRLRESREEDGDEDSNLNWLATAICFPFSPIYRFYRAWKFGSMEKKDPEMGNRFVDELLTAGVLRLFDVVLGDAPVLTLLLRDDVWGRSQDWALRINGEPDYLQCRYCPVSEGGGVDSWTIFRLFFLLSKMAQGITFYLVGIKRVQRVKQAEHYAHLAGPNARGGRLNFFATLVLYFAHFCFIGSRVMGYSMVSFTWGSWVYLILGGHWLLNSAWHLVTVFNSRGIRPARSVSSMVMGGVWLFSLTNEQGGRQLGRYILYYILAFFESAVCAFLWNVQMKGSGDFFAYKASWAVLAVFLMAVVSHTVYYSMCHPSSPSITTRGLLCFSGTRRDSLDPDEDEAASTPV